VGEFALHVPAGTTGDDAADGDVSAAFFTGETLSDVWKAFSMPEGDDGEYGGGSTGGQDVVATHTHGAATASTIVPPMSNRTVTIIFAWHFPRRYFSDKPIGNYYASHIHSSASSAAEDMAADLDSTVTTYKGWHDAFMSASSLPTWLQDVLVNSMSQWRSAFMTGDGRWRQWEAYDCVDLDSVHNDYQRQMPYALFFPSLVKNVMTTGWAKLQQSNGMITESLSGGCMGATGRLDGTV
jgi:non-lysosomal glucosylceramidase